MRRSSDSGASIVRFGDAIDKPASAGYTGDGKFDAGAFRPSRADGFARRAPLPGSWSRPSPPRGIVRYPLCLCRRIGVFREFSGIETVENFTARAFRRLEAVYLTKI
jgi:hypothetical protein